MGNGGSNHKHIDDISAPNPSIIYYRLQNVDKDGSFTHSKIVSAALNIRDSLFTFYQNPAKDAIFISGDNLSEVEIVDNAGRLVLNKQLSNASNTSIANLSKGQYIVQMKDGKGNVQTGKLVVE